MGGCWGGCRWAAAVGRLLGRLLGRLQVGGCCGRLLWAAAVGKKPPKVPVLPVCASVASGLGGRKRRCTVRSQKIEMVVEGMVGCSLKTHTYEKA